MDGLQTQWLLDPDSVDLAGATRFAIESMLASAVARLVPDASRPQDAPVDDTPLPGTPRR